MERIKTNSRGLRGTLPESLQDAHTGSLREDDQSLLKFHGMYQQDDRDRREERSSKKLEWLYSFMIRLRLPGGFLTPEQWIGLHHIAGEHSTARTIGDEPMLFHLHYDVAVGVGERRALALPQLLMDAPDTEVVLLDE